MSSSASRSTASIAQKTRFGIGDVYFLAAAYGLLEVVVDDVKRCSGRAVHLVSGRRLEVEVVLKCLGMRPDATVDKARHHITSYIAYTDVLYPIVLYIVSYISLSHMV